jgi:outer membrane PBP1 activator LpoA protein
MFQNTVLTATGVAISALLATIAVALTGCAGGPMGPESELSRSVSGNYRGGETLAVLLPQSGRFADAAQVVRDGIVAAHEADPQGKRPALRFYDSVAGPVTSLVRQAAADGASLVIGPLQRQAVNELASSSALPIPVLALNRASGNRNPPSNLYQFALSPEDEATEVANKAWVAGHRKALVLYPEGNWGNRISRAFLQEWKALGGAVVATQVFDPSVGDLSETVARLSDRAAGGDFLFMVATAKLAQQIWPQIRHKMGTGMPVYSTSHISNGRLNPQGERRLLGLYFVDIPWLLEPTPGDRVSARGLYRKLPRLYAMGVDAYRLGSRLDWMSRHRGTRISGKTGILSMDSQRQIHRELTLARIDSGGPVKVAAIDTAGPGSFVGIERLSALEPSLVASGSVAFVASHN